MANWVNLACIFSAQPGEAPPVRKLSFRLSPASCNAVHIYDYARIHRLCTLNDRRPSRAAQCDVALQPLSRPAAPSRSCNLLQTEVTYFALAPRFARNASTSALAKTTPSPRPSRHHQYIEQLLWAILERG